MPGGNPQAAVTAFLRPLQRALSTLDGAGQITVNRQGGYAKGHVYAWALNGGLGMTWAGVGSFHASMNFAIVDADPAKHGGRRGGLTVGTRGYWYSFIELDGTARWRIHWHPDGKSHHVDPHFHLQPSIKQPHPSPRVSFEQAVRWAIASGARLSCSEQVADDRLTESETGFRLYCSWRDITDPAYLLLRDAIVTNAPTPGPPTHGNS